MNVAAELRFLTEHFGMMARADQMTMLALVESRAQAQRRWLESSALVGKLGSVEDQGAARSI